MIGAIYTGGTGRDHSAHIIPPAASDRRGYGDVYCLDLGRGIGAVKSMTSHFTHSQRIEIIDLLRDCGVSEFNVSIHLSGAVAFHSNGLSAEEIECARYMLVKYLVSIT